MNPPARPRAPWSLRVAGVAILVVLGWVLFGSALSVVRAVLALAGYVIVAVVAYAAGKWVGHRSPLR